MRRGERCGGEMWRGVEFPALGRWVRWLDSVRLDGGRRNSRGPCVQRSRRLLLWEQVSQRGRRWKRQVHRSWNPCRDRRTLVCRKRHLQIPTSLVSKMILRINPPASQALLSSSPAGVWQLGGIFRMQGKDPEESRCTAASQSRPQIESPRLHPSWDSCAHTRL